MTVAIDLCAYVTAVCAAQLAFALPENTIELCLCIPIFPPTNIC